MKSRVKKELKVPAMVCLFLLLGASLALANGKAESAQPAESGTATASQPAPAPIPEVKMVSVRQSFQEDCASCHGSEAEYSLQSAREQYRVSGHYQNDNAFYANGGGCQSCHTNEGFIGYVNTGSVNPQAYVANPSQPGCFTCHTPHETWDFALRTTAPVTLANGVTFDGGDGNLCASCHLARIPAGESVKPMEAASVRATWGPHHGPQADVLKGTNAFEFPGKSYSSSLHMDVIEDGCVSCHMALPEGRFALSREVGGHSFNIAGEVHHAEKLNTAACLSCHQDIKQVEAGGRVVFDIKAGADYDQDNTVEPLQLEVAGLLAKLVNRQGTGYLQRVNPPMFRKDAEVTFESLGADWAGSRNGSWTEAQIGALYNYKLIFEDRSLGVHNPKYTIQVLYDTIQALDSSFDVSRRPE